MNNTWPYTDAVKPEIYNLGTSWPKISIITPSFNQGQFIEETILSIVNQNYPNLEYIIIDGGSTDNTVEIIKKYEANITYWISEKDNGQSHAINKGLEKSNGEILNWINSDDILLHNSLFNLASIYLLNPESTLITGCREAKSYKTGVTIIQTDWEMNWFNYILKRPNFPQDCTFFTKKTLNLLKYRIDESYHFVMDSEFYLRILLTKEVNLVFTNTVFSRMNIHPLQKTNSADIKRQLEITRYKNKYNKQLKTHKIEVFYKIVYTYILRKRRNLFNFKLYYSEYNFSKMVWELVKFSPRY